MRAGPQQHRAFTLLEVSLVIAMLVVLAAMVVPDFMGQLRADELPRSARQLRSLITMARANAAFDGKRYRIRFPNEDELDSLGGEIQPLIEREEDPIHDPEIFAQVTAPWALGKILLGDVWVSEVRPGRPTIEKIRERRERVAEDLERDLRDEEEEFKDFDPDRMPLFIEPDGTSEWATFVLTTAPQDVEPDEVDEYPQVEVILDGATGLAWLQRPFYEEELDLFEEKGWPAVLRQDFLDPRELTEDDVLEIRESQLRGAEVKLEGTELEVQP